MTPTLTNSNDLVAAGPWWRRLTSGVRRLWQRPDWPRYAGPDWADRIMTAAVTDRYHAKQGRSTGRWRLEADGARLTVYLKRHYRLAWWRGILALVWPNGAWSPAVQEWRHLQWARQAGMPVPQAVAAGEVIGPWGRLTSFLAVEELTGMSPLHEAIPSAARNLDPAAFARWKRGLIAELVGIVRPLHERRGFHKDLYLCHFYIPDEATQQAEYRTGSMHVIDLHRLGHHPITAPFWRAKDLAQLLYSSDVAGVTLRDRWRFWQAYLGGRHGGLTVAVLRWAVLFKWRLYRRHHRRKAR